MSTPSRRMVRRSGAAAAEAGAWVAGRAAGGSAVTLPDSDADAAGDAPTGEVERAGEVEGSSDRLVPTVGAASDDRVAQAVAPPARRAAASAAATPLKGLD
jgi:hypothetical protein